MKNNLKNICKEIEALKKMMHRIIIFLLKLVKANICVRKTRV